MTTDCEDVTVSSWLRESSLPLSPASNQGTKETWYTVFVYQQTRVSMGPPCNRRRTHGYRCIQDLVN